jgi:hypothetical protein
MTQFLSYANTRFVTHDAAVAKSTVMYCSTAQNLVRWLKMEFSFESGFCNYFTDEI